MSLYGANGQINTTSVAGSSYTGLYAADGSYNIVINDGTALKGLHHPCGAFNAVITTNSAAGFYAPNGSMNVIANGSSPSGYSPVQPAGGVSTGNLQINWVAEGDSITAGLGGVPAYPFVALASQPGATPSTPGTNTPLSSPVTGVGTVFLNDIATSGISSISIDNLYSTRGGAAYDGTKNLNILSMMIGTNGSGVNDATAGQRYWWTRDYLRKALNTGYNRIIVQSMIALDSSPAQSTGILAPLGTYLRTYYNSDMQADYLSDVGSNVNFNPATPSVADNLTYYISDMIHPNVFGEATLGGIFAPQLTAALAGPGTKTFAPATWSPFSNAVSTGGLDGFDGTTSLSNGFRTASVPTGNTAYMIRGFPGTRSTKVYWETTPTVATTVVSGIGTDSYSYVSHAVPGADLNSLSYVSDGRILKNGATVVTIPTYATGDTIRHAIDPVNKLYWTARIRSGVSQPWNGNGSADPATGVGGVDISYMTLGGAGDRFYPAAGFFTGTDAVTSNFASSQMIGTIPSGYTTFG